MPQRRARHVAGIRPPRPVDRARPTTGKKYLAAITWPVRTGFRTIASIVVAALTALVVGYVVTRQDAVFDAVGDALGDDPLLVHAFELEPAQSVEPLALPSVLAAETMGKVANGEDYGELLESAHAVPLDRSEVEVTLEGNRHESVLVERISARVVSRTAAPTGTFISPFGGGGPEEKIRLELDLDSPDKRARELTDDGSPGEVFDERNYIEIQRGEKVVFTFLGVTSQAYLYEWVIDLVVQVDGRRVTVTVGAESPFSVSGTVDDYGAYYLADSEGLMEAVPAEEMCPLGCTNR